MQIYIYMYVYVYTNESTVNTAKLLMCFMSIWLITVTVSAEVADRFGSPTCVVFLFVSVRLLANPFERL